MPNNQFAYRNMAENLGGGRAGVLLLLFALALYMFYSAGFPAFAVVCASPLLVLGVLITLEYRMFIFWLLVFINYFVQWKDFPSTGIPMSLYNEALELLLLALAIIRVEEARFERLCNVMLIALCIWCTFCTLEVLNVSLDMGIQFGPWYTGARMMAFQLLYAFLVFSLYITSPKTLMTYLVVWGCLAVFAAIWVWKQQNIELTVAERSFLYGRGRSTHVINGGATIRYFSIFSDAANFGVGMASTAAAFLIFAINTKVKKYKYFFLLVGLAAGWAMFPSGTRTATFCFFAGVGTYIFLSKSMKIAVPVSILAFVVYLLLAFTEIGNGNAQIRRMRSGFDKNDASMGARYNNQAVMKKYMKDIPWGIGLGMGNDNVPPNNKFYQMAIIPPDSEYVYVWLRTGYVGLTVFLVTTVIMFVGACWVVLFRIRSKSLRGIGAGLCCAFASVQLGGYANQVLMQFPNCLVVYGGLAMVFGLPLYEKEWEEWEAAQLARQEERRRLKLEKKLASRVKT